VITALPRRIHAAESVFVTLMSLYRSVHLDHQARALMLCGGWRQMHGLSAPVQGQAEASQKDRSDI